MSDWKEYKVGNYVSFQNGYAFNSKSFSNTGKHLVVRIKEIKNGFIKFSADSARVDIENEFAFDKYKIKKGDILFALTGDPVSRSNCLSWVGRIALYNHEETALLNQRLCKGIFSKDIYPLFFYYYFRLKENLFDLARRATGSANQANISTNTISKMLIKLPPLETQKKIAAVLSALDDKIELNNAINKNLEEQAQAIYKKMFVDNFNPALRNGTLGEFVEVKRGGSPRPIQDYLSDEGLRWLKISDVTSLASPYVLNVKEHIKESGLSKTVFLTAGSLVLSNSATPGVPKILDVDTCIHDGWLYFPDSKFSKYFLYLYFKRIKNQLVNLGNGSVFTNLKIEIVKSFPVRLPDEKTLRLFDEIIAPLFESMKNIAHENQKLGEIRDALLPRLMSGEIDVSTVGI